MKPYYQDNHLQIFNRDCRSMDELADESVQMVVTSPPYWGLRKYAGVPDLVWGDKDCEHEWGDTIPNPMCKSGKHGPASMMTKTGTGDAQHEIRIESNQGSFCHLCGAWKGSYGLEPTPEMYIEHTIEILREIRRVLRSDGVVFWNIGDSYVTSSPGTSYMEPVTWSESGQSKKIGMTRTGRVPGLKPKDLCLIPFRVAIAAQQDGWWVRSVIIWSKPNPMPESVTDRPTESHEYILLLTKSARYYWDADAVRESESPNTHSRGKGGRPRMTMTKIAPAGQGIRNNPSFQAAMCDLPKGSGRNIRSIWEFPTQPYPEAHFAVFPEKLPEICIKAATPEVGCCGKCGAPWQRIVGGKPSHLNIRVRDAKAGRATPEEGYKATQEEIDGYPGNHPDPGYRQTIGWRPTCNCKTIKPPVPSIVLDPFAGAGTTLWVAKTLGRKAIGYELSEEYCELSVERNRQQALGFNIAERG